MHVPLCRFFRRVSPSVFVSVTPVKYFSKCGVVVDDYESRLSYVLGLYCQAVVTSARIFGIPGMHHLSTLSSGFCYLLIELPNYACYSRSYDLLFHPDYRFQTLRATISLTLVSVARHMAIVGSKGHVATFDWQTGTMHSELQLQETCRDITYVSHPPIPFHLLFRYLLTNGYNG